jgi:integrase
MVFPRASQSRFSSAEAQRGPIRDNPCEHIRPATKSTPRNRTLPDSKQATFIRASQQFGFPFDTIVLLLIFTGQRRGEVAALRWEWIDDDAKTITLPASVTKNKRKHTLPYGKLVADVLQSLPRQGDLLFPARGRFNVPYSGWSKNKIVLDRVCKIEPWTLHDLRRTFATNLASLSTPPHVVEKLLNHASGTISGVASAATFSCTTGTAFRRADGAGSSTQRSSARGSLRSLPPLPFRSMWLRPRIPEPSGALEWLRPIRMRASAEI